MQVIEIPAHEQFVRIKSSRGSVSTLVRRNEEALNVDANDEHVLFM